MFSSSPLGSVTYFPAEALHVPFTVYCPSVFLLSGAPSSQVLCLSLTSSSHLSVSDLVYLTTLSFRFFPFFSLIPWLLLLSWGWLTPAAPLWCRTLPFRSSALAAGICTLSIPICNKLSFQLLPIVPTPRWFLSIKERLLLG